MSAIRAIVRNGRLVIDEPTALPEGTVLNLVVEGEGDDLDDDERALLHEAISEGLRDAQAGRTIPADELLAELRRRR